MNAMPLDTHETVKSLKQAGFTEDQAEAVTRAVQKASGVDLTPLAMKGDLRELELKIDTKLAEFEVRITRYLIDQGIAVVGLILGVLKLFPS